MVSAPFARVYSLEKKAFMSRGMKVCLPEVPLLYETAMPALLKELITSSWEGSLLMTQPPVYVGQPEGEVLRGS